MSYLSGYREQQHYESASSIPPFDVCVSTSRQPRVLSSFTPLRSTLRRMHISSQGPCYRRVAALCRTPRFLSHSQSFVLSRYLVFDHVSISPLFQAHATHRCRAGDKGVR